MNVTAIDGSGGFCRDAHAAARDGGKPRKLQSIRDMKRPREEFRCLVVAVFMALNPFQIIMAQEDTIVIDDRRSGDYGATSGSEWRLITDGVMGGVSDGRLSIEAVQNRSCLRLTGDVKLDNNGGFVQAALELPKDTLQDIQTYTGITVEVYGNNEQYNVHLRTRDNTFPWQSYRATLNAAPEWKTLFLPFTEFTPYRTSKRLDVSRLKRIGMVAIGREFRADLCIGKLGLYK